MSTLLREAAFLLRQRSAIVGVLILTLLAALATGLGLAEVARQQDSIARAVALQAIDEAAVARFVEDGGSAAYYSFHVAADAPSNLAFAALGQRDLAPFIMRIRALALEGQLYENESTNPEVALPGRFDFAFVLFYLAPLLLIALLHDLVSGEREAGRWTLLQSAPRSRGLWGARVLVRALIVFAALGVPLCAGAMLSGAAPTGVLAALGVVALTVVFWTAISLAVARSGWRSAVNATSLAAIWFGLTLVAPSAAHLVVNAIVPMPQGAELLRANREAVHAGWDLPQDATMQRFFVTHPEWSDTPALRQPFHWKWYFAFQQLGDEHVARQSQEYRDGIARREALARTAGWVLPPLGLQQALHRLAGTDGTAQLAYQQRVREFHARLREFYYPYMFNEQPFRNTDFGLAPRFDTGAGSSRASRQP